MENVKWKKWDIYDKFWQEKAEVSPLLPDWPGKGVFILDMLGLTNLEIEIRRISTAEFSVLVPKRFEKRY